MNAEAPGPIEVETRFERFPATVKGAFVLRGLDGQPHLVRLAESRILRVPEGDGKMLPGAGAMVDVAPRRDVFLPFEAVIADLTPGWYAIRSDILVDGRRSFANVSRPFVVAWPTGHALTGVRELGRSVEIGERSFRLLRMELRPDLVAIVWEEEGGAPGAGEPALSLFVDGRLQEPLPASAERGPRGKPLPPGEGRRSLFYPVARVLNGRLEIAIALAGMEAQAVRLRVSLS